MKKNHPIFSLIVLLCALNTNLHAQINNYSTFIATGGNDAEELFKAYMGPYMQGFGSSLSGGWYHTAKSHELGGFDVNLCVSGTIIPQSDRVYSVNDLDLQNLVPTDGSDMEQPTVAGEKEEGGYMSYNYNGLADTAYRLPAGTGIPFVPTPMVQASVGLIKNTEIIGRYMPYVGNDKGELGFWGVGVKHDIKQWIPVISKVPVLNMSILVGYTRFKAHTVLQVDPADMNLGDYTELNSREHWTNQKMNLSIGNLTSNLILSADLPLVSVYGGVGFIRTNSILELKGNYPMISSESIESGGDPEVVAVKDPLKIEIKNQNGGMYQPRVNVGASLKLGIIYLNADYTWANYSMITAGFGVTFR